MYLFSGVIILHVSDYLLVPGHAARVRYWTDCVRDEHADTSPCDCGVIRLNFYAAICIFYGFHERNTRRGIFTHCLSATMLEGRWKCASGFNSIRGVPRRS